MGRGAGTKTFDFPMAAAVAVGPTTYANRNRSSARVPWCGGVAGVAAAKQGAAPPPFPDPRYPSPDPATSATPPHRFALLGLPPE
jgi:hypothetical protein